MIHSFDYCVEKIGEVGKVQETMEFLVKADGLPRATIGEGVTFETGEHGRILSLEKDLVEILVLSQTPVRPGIRVARTGIPVSISAGEGVLGHMLNTIGHSLTDRRQKSYKVEKRAIETTPVGIMQRRKISHFFETGIPLVDLLVPIGMGQRELVIGDRKTGKSHFLLQTILTQAKLGNIVIYCAIGKRKTEIKSIDEFLERNKILQNCVIIAADSHSSPGEIFLAPYTAMTIAEHFRDQGKNIYVILDDLTTHAKYYREISLLAGRFPGRESYPGDIFHVHSKLLERAGCFKVDGKEGTITCLPVAESVGGDMTGYIQTNLMSMTDGHIYFDSELFYQGRRPAINVFLSVTRVGRQTQSPVFRELGSRLMALLQKYEQAKRFLRFGPELSTEIKDILDKGNAVNTFFNKVGFISVSLDEQKKQIQKILQ